MHFELAGLAMNSHFGSVGSSAAAPDGAPAASTNRANATSALTRNLLILHPLSGAGPSRGQGTHDPSPRANPSIARDRPCGASSAPCAAAAGAAPKHDLPLRGERCVLEVVPLLEVRDQPGVRRLPAQPLAGQRAGGRSVEREEGADPAELLVRALRR